MTDGIDLATVQIHNSHDVRSWPATATLERLEFRRTGVHVEHSKRLGEGCWPNFRPPGWDGDLQYTLWIFLLLDGAWHGSGCIEFWQSCDENGGPPDEFAKNWYYDPNRWAPMTGHQPVIGESVGFMVSAGDARNSGAQSVQERSQIVRMDFPVRGATWVRPADVDPAPAPTPAPTPPDGPPPLTPAVVEVLERLLRVLDTQTVIIQQLAAAQATKTDLDTLQHTLVEQGRLIAAALRQRITR